MAISIHPVLPADKTWVRDVFLKWGAEFIVSCGRCAYYHQVEGFYAASEDGQRVGLVTYEVTDGECEVVTLDAFEQFAGIGTALMTQIESTMRQAGVRRIWFITTNDNLDAIRFYHRRGYTLAGINVHAIAESRKLKPSISLIGSYGIPIRDELIFEKFLVE